MREQELRTKNQELRTARRTKDEERNEERYEERNEEWSELLLFRATRVIAAWGLILLLVAVYPANIHMALNPDLYPSMSPAVLWARLPLQFVLIAIGFWLRR